MDLYNHIIESLPSRFGSQIPRRYAYDPKAAWADTGSFEVVMLKNTAFELGGEGKAAVTFSCVTSSPRLVDKDEILVIGPDLNQIKSNRPYARIALLQVGDIESDDEDDTEEAYRAIQDIDFVKYRVFPKGYMIRTLAESGREQVRVSKEAVKRGITFQQIGSTFLMQYKQNPHVLRAKVIFLTAPDVDYAALSADAKMVRDITMSLTTILKGLPTDCSTCQLKSICDEVDGMRELHFGKERHASE